MITMNKNPEDKLTEKEIKDIISRDNLTYKENRAYYENKSPTLESIHNIKKQLQISPNNFAPSGYCSYMVDIMTGYVASPGFVDYASDNVKYLDVIKYINKKNKEATVTNKEVREGAIQGKDYELHFVEKDDNGQMLPRFVSVKGNQCYPVYTEDLDPKLYCMIRKIKRESYSDVWVYYNKVIVKYKLRDETLTNLNDDEENLYKSVPWNIGENNIDREPDYKKVKVYIDVIDALQTNTLNALDKNGRALIKTTMSKEGISKDLKELNAIFDMDPGSEGEGADTFTYEALELNSDLREVMLTHFISELHKISGIFDFTKLELGQDPSGTALKYRIYPMELKASGKVALRVEFLRHRYELITDIINNYTISGNSRISGADVDDLKITMNRNLPANIKAVLEENILMGMDVDKQTKLERIPGIDAEEVMKRVDSQSVDVSENKILDK